MKKIFLVIIAFLIGINVYSQSHLQFMGIEIDGPINSFVQKLNNKGFTLVKKLDSGGAQMKGKFTGKDVELYISVTPVSKNVRSVNVYFPEDKSWSSIKYDYNKLKDSYKQKYILEKEYEFFEDPYYEGDGYEMQAVRNDKCHYATFFSSETGGIMLDISKYEQLHVLYEDSINSSIGSEERDTKILDEI